MSIENTRSTADHKLTTSIDTTFAHSTQARHSTSSEPSYELSFISSVHPHMSSLPISKRKPIQAQNSLRVLNVNFQSLKKKGMLLEALASFTNPDIIIGTETWPNDQIASPKFISNQLDYKIYRRDRPSDNYGGVLLVAKKRFNSQQPTQK